MADCPKGSPKGSENRTFDFETGISRLYIDYSEILQLSRGVAGQVNPEKYDFVIGIANGGLAVAQIVFDEIRERNPALGVGSIQMKRYRGTNGGEPEFLYFPEETLRGKRLIVCDELVDEGATLGALSRKIDSIGAKADYLALYEKDGAGFSPERVAREIPRTIFHEKKDFQNWLVFPWEKEWGGKGYIRAVG